MNRLPHGVRDHLPVAAAQRRRLVSALCGEFAGWGYRAVITPLYEYDQVLARGLGEGGARATRFVEPASGEILALRPDLTPQVARLVATRLHDQPGPIRLFYEGSVVRDGEELFQVGVELVDAPQAGGDLEALALASAALGAARVAVFTLDLGHAAVVAEALADLGLDEGDEAALHDALAKKNAARVAALAGRARAPLWRKKLVAALPSLYGGPEVLARARKLLAPSGSGAASLALDELELLLQQLAELEPQRAVSVDLGEVRGFRYYTGTRFAAYTSGAGGALAQGGRYDEVVERYGRAARATGFAVDIDLLGESLRQRGTAPVVEGGGVLVAGEALAAARLALQLRRSGERAILDLDQPSPGDRVLAERAARLGLAQVAVARAGGRDPKRFAALAPSRPPR